MLATILRATATVITEIISNEPEFVLPLHIRKPPVKLDSPLEEIIILGNEYCVMPRARRNSFFANTNGARAPHSPR